MKKRIAIVAGTRPEIIKLAPVVKALEASKSLEPWLVATGQHKEMAEKAFSDFELKPDVDLALMKAGQTPNSFLARALEQLEKEFEKNRPSCVLVQGDTTSALAGALTAFHGQIPVGHVEAGLRTHNLQAPFPEEMNRSTIGRVATFHFASTEGAKANLAAERIQDNVLVTGNTVIDALLWMVERLDSRNVSPERSVQRVLESNKDIVLVTGHRRENFEAPLLELCDGLAKLAQQFPEISIVYPVHLNPKVSAPVHESLEGIENVHLLSPIDYPSMIALMKRARLIITDSGGIQEEAPTFKVPILVTRRSTERPEAIDAGFARLVNLREKGALFRLASEVVNSQEQPDLGENPFGSGKASGRIVEFLEQKL